MRNLVIDIGNTNTKVAVFKGKELVHYQIFREIVSDDVSVLVDSHHIEYSTISSVNDCIKDMEFVLKEKTRYVPFSTKIRTGIHNKYKSSSTLGLDRWAKVIAAFYNYPGQNCFMIDAGTCITYDFLNNNGEYFGGSISLGVNMRFKALSHFTGRLPLIKWDGDLKLIPKGVDTSTAIQNGVLQGIINEVEGFISLQYKDNEDVKVLITGGDAPFLSGQLKNSIFASKIINDPYLVLKGLNEVIALEYV